MTMERKNRMKKQLVATTIITLMVLPGSLTTTSWSQTDGQDTRRTSAIYIDNGKYQTNKSTASAVSGGKITGSMASGVKINSKADNFSGLYVKGGRSIFTLSDSTIDLHGNGSKEGAEVGAMVDEGGTLILRNVKITTSGLRTPSIVAKNRSLVKIFDSTIRTNGGTQLHGVKYEGANALGPAGPLGLGGNARNTLVTNMSEAFYYNSTIISESWGALSTDWAGGFAYLEANDCDIQTIHEGYGTYADNGTEVVINNSKMNNGAYTAILESVATLTLNNVNAVSRRYAILVHNIFGQPMETGILKIKGGRFESQRTALLIPGCNVNIFLEGVTLVPGDGVIIHSMVNMDPNGTKTNGVKVPGIHISMKDENLEGNVIHEDTDREMTLTFVNSKLKGAVENVSLTLNAGSKWTATGDSRVALAGKTDVDCMDAPVGVTITAVAGKDCVLKGSYKLANGGVLFVSGN
jgi:hypothetical protein